MHANIQVFCRKIHSSVFLENRWTTEISNLIFRAANTHLVFLFLSFTDRSFHFPAENRVSNLPYNLRIFITIQRSKMSLLW